jgi:hypothetical protein
MAMRKREKHQPFIPRPLRLTFLNCIACGGWEVAGLETRAIHFRQMVEAFILVEVG